ncbi:RDD family protein [Pelagicoccus sp. SDUM812005]|uniref:RDD family protein n=1 Tax=Pelagicoccus sp. SDUM812005 TaxID=3041257 RepID=UPI00280C4566|nr:RDD family protein [Pelagicoccus sp. SDUM812005]MDQ8181705.1 RDD family protein [Pelagicoccus sp. SDUM812005]
MPNSLIHMLVNLAVALLIAALVYNHYKSRVAAPGERYSTFWPRFLSPSIDGVILWPVTALLPVIVFDLAPAAYSAVNIAVTLFFYGYSIYFHGTYGGTIGKLKTGIRVVDAKTEQPIGMRQALLRDIVPLALALFLYAYAFSQAGMADFESSPYVAWVPALFGFWFLAEIVTMLTNEKRRALHDFIAGTVVIRPTPEELELKQEEPRFERAS